MHSNWRDSQAWKDHKLPLSTTSNEACKLFDSVLTQYVGWHNDPNFGGIEGTFAKLVEADQNFLMGKVFLCDAMILGSGRNPDLNPELQLEIEQVRNMLQHQELTKREKLHGEATLHMAKGEWCRASQVLEDILVDHPTDLLALKMATDIYFYLGDQIQLRNSVSRVLPSWSDSLPMKSYLYGMQAFGMNETNLYDSAEKSAKEGLKRNKNDGWSSHALAHVYEMTGQQDAGIAFLSKTIQDWTYSDVLKGHNFWHWTLYHIEKGEHDAALDIFDTAIAKQVREVGSTLDLVDGASLLYRLTLEGVKVGKDRWRELFAICEAYKEQHVQVFNDFHILFVAQGLGETEFVDTFMGTAEERVRKGVTSDYKRQYLEAGANIIKALAAKKDGDHSKVVDLLHPVKDKIRFCGGSNAQRDVFDLMLIDSMIKSGDNQHHNLARSFLYERQALRPNSPLTDRLAARLMAAHELSS